MHCAASIPSSIPGALHALCAHHVWRYATGGLGRNGWSAQGAPRMPWEGAFSRCCQDTLTLRHCNVHSSRPGKAASEKKGSFRGTTTFLTSRPERLRKPAPERGRPGDLRAAERTAWSTGLEDDGCPLALAPNASTSRRYLVLSLKREPGIGQPLLSS